MLSVYLSSDFFMVADISSANISKLYEEFSKGYQRVKSVGTYGVSAFQSLRPSKTQSLQPVHTFAIFAIYYRHELVFLFAILGGQHTCFVGFSFSSHRSKGLILSPTTQGLFYSPLVKKTDKLIQLFFS